MSMRRHGLVALLLLTSITPLDARTKNSRLQLRLSREPPLRDVPAWDDIPRARLTKGVRVKMAAVRDAACVQEQIDILHALADEDGARADSTAAASVALALLGVLLARASSTPSGPLSTTVAACLNALPDEAVADAASFFVGRLIAQDPTRSASGVVALCSLRGKQGAMTQACVRPDVFRHCLEAVRRADNPSQCLSSLHALKTLLDLGARRLSESLPLSFRSEGRDCLTTKVSSKYWSHECQIAAAQSLALILTASRPPCFGEEWEFELQHIVKSSMPAAKFVLLRTILLKIPLQDFSERGRTMIWSAIMRQYPISQASTPDAGDKLKSTGSSLPRPAGPVEDPAKLLAEGLEAASQFLASETAALVLGTVHVDGALSRVRDAFLCVMASPVGSWGVDDNRILKLYTAARVQRDACLNVACGRQDQGKPPELTIAHALGELSDGKLLQAAMAIEPACRVRYLLARPLVGSLFDEQSSGRARRDLLCATLRALATSRALTKVAVPLLGELISSEARGEQGWWVEFLELALLDENLREPVANHALPVIARNAVAADSLLRRLVARQPGAGRGRGGVSALHRLRGLSGEHERVLWAVLRLIDAILRGDEQGAAGKGSSVLRLEKLASSLVKEASVGCDPDLRLQAFRLTLQYDGLMPVAQAASCDPLLRGFGGSNRVEWVLRRIALATDFKGVPQGMCNEMLHETRRMVSAFRIASRRDLTDAAPEAAQFRELQFLQGIGSLVDAALCPTMGTAVSRKVACIELLSMVLDVFVPRVAERIDARLHSPACVSAKAAPAQRRVPTAGRELALGGSPCLCGPEQDTELGDDGVRRTTAIAVALRLTTIIKKLLAALLHNFERVRARAAHVLVRLARVQPGLGLSMPAVLEVMQTAESLTSTSARKQNAEGGALLIQVAGLCLAPAILSCPLFASAPEASASPAIGSSQMPSLEGRAREVIDDSCGIQSRATVLLYSRTLQRLRNVTEQASHLGLSQGAPPGFAHALFLVLRKLLPQASARETCDDDSALGLLWFHELRNSMREGLTTLELARQELNDAYVCSGAMDDDEEDGGGGASVEQVDDTDELVDSCVRQTQRGCWLTLKEGVLFLAELSRVALAWESPQDPTQMPAEPSAPVFSFPDFEEIGQAMITVIFSSQHSGLVDQTAGALRTLAAALLESKPNNAPMPSPRLYHGALSQGLRALSLVQSPQRSSEQPFPEVADEGLGAVASGRGECVSELPRAWLQQLIARISDEALSIGRRSSQLSMAIQALLAADAGVGMYGDALPYLLAAAGEAPGDQACVSGTNCTRVRAIMALQCLLRDARCGEKVIRLAGDDVLCKILLALQCESWAVRNAANLALGAAVERAMGRDQARAPRASTFFKSFPRFASAVVEFLSGCAASPRASGNSTHDRALVAILALLARLSPGVTPNDWGAEAATGAPHSVDMLEMVGEACNELGGVHPRREIREACFRVAMSVSSASGQMDNLIASMRALVSSPVLARDNLRLESICQQLVQSAVRVLPPRGECAETHLRAHDVAEMERLCSDVSLTVSQVFAGSWKDLLQDSHQAVFSISAHAALLALLQVAARLFEVARGTCRAREALLRAADRVLTWLLPSLQLSSSELTCVPGLPSLLHDAAGFCLRAKGFDADSSEHGADICQWKVCREVLVPLLTRREDEIRLGCLQSLADCLKESPWAGREVSIDLWRLFGQERNLECEREYLVSLIAIPPFIKVIPPLVEEGEEQQAWSKIRGAIRTREPWARGMALVALAGICGRALVDTADNGASCCEQASEERYVDVEQFRQHQSALVETLPLWMDAVEKDSNAAGGVSSRRAAAVALCTSRILSPAHSCASPGDVCAKVDLQSCCLDDELVVRGWVVAMRLLQDEDSVVSAAASSAVTSGARLIGSTREGWPQSLHAPIALNKAAGELVRFLAAGRGAVRVWQYIGALLDEWMRGLGSANAQTPIQYSRTLLCLSGGRGQNQIEKEAAQTFRSDETSYESEPGLALAAIMSQMQELEGQGTDCEWAAAANTTMVEIQRFREWRALEVADRWRGLLAGVDLAHLLM